MNHINEQSDEQSDNLSANLIDFYWIMSCYYSIVTTSQGDVIWNTETHSGVENTLFRDCADWYDLDLLNIDAIKTTESLKVWNTSLLTTRASIRQPLNVTVGAIAKYFRDANREFSPQELTKISVAILSTLDMALISHPYIKQRLIRIREQLRNRKPFDYFHYIRELEYLEFKWHMPHYNNLYIEIEKPYDKYDRIKSEFKSISDHSVNLRRELHTVLDKSAPEQDSYPAQDRSDLMEVPYKYYDHLRLIEILGKEGYNEYVAKMNNHLIKKVKKLLEFLVCELEENLTNRNAYKNKQTRRNETFSEAIDDAVRRGNFLFATGNRLKEAFEEVKRSTKAICPSVESGPPLVPRQNATKQNTPIPRNNLEGDPSQAVVTEPQLVPIPNVATQNTSTSLQQRRRYPGNNLEGDPPRAVVTEPQLVPILNVATQNTSTSQQQRRRYPGK